MNLDECLESWVHEYANRLTQIAFTYSRDWSAAEDITQETLVKAYKSAHQLTQPDNPFPWLVRIVINECKTAFRRTRWREVLTTVIPDRMVPSAEDVYVESTETKEVYEAVLLLPEKYRTPIVLHYFEDMGLHEIADVLEVNHSTIRTRLARARERLGKQLNRGAAYEPGTANPQCKTLL